MPTDYRSLYDKEYIGAWDLDGGDKEITITKVKGGELTSPGGRKNKKPVVYFQGSEKGFALNATNGKTIAALYGNYVEKWPGKSITLYKSTTRSPQGDGDVECIRVRPQAPKVGAAAFPEEGGEALVTPEQALELEALCTEPEPDISAEFKKVAGVERFAQVLAVDYAKGKKWIQKRRQGQKETAQA